MLAAYDGDLLFKTWADRWAGARRNCLEYDDPNHCVGYPAEARFPVLGLGRANRTFATVSLVGLWARTECRGAKGKGRGPI